MQDGLVLRTKEAGKADAHTLFEAWFPKAWRIAKAVCGSRAAAEDAVQEALIRFWRKLPDLKNPEAAEGYFLRIVVNEARRIHTQSKAELEDPTIDESGGSTASAEAEAGSREQFRLLMDEIGRLPKKLRDAVRLHYLGGISVEETAKLLGTSASSVKMRLSRARAKLKQMLEQMGYEVIGG